MAITNARLEVSPRTRSAILVAVVSILTGILTPLVVSRLGSMFLLGVVIVVTGIVLYASRIEVRPHRFMHPAFLLLIPVAVSFSSWIIPWGSGVRRGFDVREPLTILAVMLIVGWYGLILLCSTIGYRIGQSLRPAAWIDSTPDRAYYWFFTVVALIGVAYTFGQLALAEPGVILTAITNQDFNSLRMRLPYESGPLTLRYAAIVSGALAIHELFWKRQISLVGIINICLLLAVASLASRLSLVLALLLAISIVIYRNRERTMSLFSIYCACLLLFLAIAPLNFIRNANFYREYYSVSDPITMNAYEIIAYLGSPFQVAVGVSNAPAIDANAGNAGVIDNALGLVTPTYLGSGNTYRLMDEQVGYRRFVDVEDALTTNSAFAVLYGSMGIPAFAFIGVVAFAAALLAGHTSSYRSYFFLAAAIVLYCFAELWRIYLFNFGIIHFLVISLLIPPIVYRLVRGRRALDAPLAALPARSE